jgi:hypothetical protein
MKCLVSGVFPSRGKRIPHSEIKRKKQWKYRPRKQHEDHAWDNSQAEERRRKTKNVRETHNVSEGRSNGVPSALAAWPVLAIEPTNPLKPTKTATRHRRAFIHQAMGAVAIDRSVPLMQAVSAGKRTTDGDALMMLPVREKICRKLCKSAPHGFARAIVPDTPQTQTH